MQNCRRSDRYDGPSLFTDLKALVSRTKAKVTQRADHRGPLTVYLKITANSMETTQQAMCATVTYDYIPS